MKILFISHDSSLTGAPMVLVHFLRWLRKNRESWTLHLATLSGGKLDSEFKQLTSEFFDLSNDKQLEDPAFSSSSIQRLYNKLFKNQADRKPKAPFPNDYDVLYANTVVSLTSSIEFKKANPKVKLILHVHELDPSIQCMVPDFGKLAEEADHIIAASALVKRNLTERYRIQEQVISVVYEMSDVNFRANSVKPQSKKAFVVGASGMVHNRKGYDVFIQVARFIHKNFPDAEIEFHWVGYIDDTLRIVIESDLEKLGIFDKVKFLGQKSPPYPFFEQFDIFFLCSREDPFPLVCIEVGLLGKPIVCFESASGTAEVVKNGGGRVVNYLDIEDAANAIIEYYNNSSLVFTDGQYNKESFSQFRPEVISPALADLIEHIDR